MKTIETLRSHFPIKELCSLLGVPKSTYYRWKHQVSSEDPVEQAVIETCKKHKYRYGYRRVTACIRKQFQTAVNHKRVLRIMRENGVLSKSRKKRKVFYQGQDSIVADNRIQRNFQADRPNQKWYTDITYLPFGKQMLYLSSIQDGFNNEIVSFRISTKQNLQLVLDTLEDACLKRKVSGIILHSDQGGVYTSKEFQRRAKEKGMLTSMSRKGNCHDNALIESFHSQLKVEGFYSQSCRKTTNSIVLEMVENYIHYYNQERIQEKLNYLSPLEYRKQVG